MRKMSSPEFEVTGHPAVAERAFLRLLYPSHPYGHLAIGSEESLQSLSLEDVVSFHRAVFLPGRATLVVAGALSGLEAFQARAQRIAAAGAQ